MKCSVRFVFSVVDNLMMVMWGKKLFAERKLIPNFAVNKITR